MAASPPESFWRSLHYFGIYRLIAAGVFVFGALPNRWWLPVIGEGTGPLFLLCIGYFLSALAIVGVLVRAGLGFNLLLTIEVATDIVFLTLMMHVGGSARSGFGYMLMVVLAGAGLVGQGRLTLFYAALARLAVLLEQGYRVLKAAADPADFIHTGSISVGFFAIALSARLLASRVVAQEELARQRGAELADQLRITRQVMRDMQDGVLVVDPSGLVRQHNPQALALLGRSVAALRNFPPRLASDIRAGAPAPAKSARPSAFPAADGWSGCDTSRPPKAAMRWSISRIWSGCRPALSRSSWRPWVD